MCVCLFSIEIQTARLIGMKFGTEVVLEGGEGSWGGGSTGNPHLLGTGCIKGVLGASGASAVHFGKNLIEQKL